MGINLSEVSQKVLDTVHNASAVLRRMYDLHYNQTPMDVELDFVDENGQKRTTKVPNRQKILEDFEGWKADFEQNKVFKVEGDENKFYPVVIDTSYQHYHFFITRDSVHWDGMWHGRVTAKFFGISNHFGHGADYRVVATLLNAQKRFLARAYEEHGHGAIIVYLRGNTTYRFRGRFCRLGDFDAKEKIFTRTYYGDNVSATFLPIDDGTDTTFIAPFAQDFIEQPSGFPLITPTTDGKVINTTNQ